MSGFSQTNAATAEESAAASEELNAQAEVTMSVVGQLQALVTGEVEAVGRPAGGHLRHASRASMGSREQGTGARAA